ncbi:hypothetical protein niasHS_008047 [Heterodera schachtii]|uniref:DNA polymerase epsilon catalytic subunit n=1 Tax=Heterodera schachtii TaxID=97005 RepID=A0ABD2JC29_HETSC
MVEDDKVEALFRRAENSTKEQRLEAIRQRNFIDAKFGYQPYTETTARDAWLINVQQAELFDEQTKSILAAVELYFLEEDGSRFKICYPFRPYLYLETNHGQEFVVAAYLSKKYHFVHIEHSEKENLDLKNHLAGLRSRFLRISFPSSAEMAKFKRDLMPRIKKNRLNIQQSSDYTELLTEYMGGAGKTHFDDGPLEQIVDIREYDLPFDMRVCIDQQFFVGQWYTVLGRDPTTKKPSISRNEALVDPPEPVVWKIVQKFKKKKIFFLRVFPKICAFDIETTKAPLKFPDANVDKIMECWTVSMYSEIPVGNLPADVPSLALDVAFSRALHTKNHLLSALPSAVPDFGGKDAAFTEARPFVFNKETFEANFVTAELSLGAVAVTALLQSANISEAEGTSEQTGFAATASAQPTTMSIGEALSHRLLAGLAKYHDDTVAVGPALRCLRELVAFPPVPARHTDHTDAQTVPAAGCKSWAPLSSTAHSRALCSPQTEIRCPSAVPLSIRCWPRSPGGQLFASLQLGLKHCSDMLLWIDHANNAFVHASDDGKDGKVMLNFALAERLPRARGCHTCFTTAREEGEEEQDEEEQQQRRKQLRLDSEDDDETEQYNNNMREEHDGEAEQQQRQ